MASSGHQHRQRVDSATQAARRRASVVAVIASLAMVPWFWTIDALAGLRPETPEPGASGQEFVDFFVGNISHLPWRTTMFVVEWLLLLVVLVAVVRAVCPRLDLAALLAVCLATAASTVYVVAEGVFSWPVVQTGATPESVRSVLDPGVARAVALSRDGLHAPASILLGVSVLLIGWLLLRSQLWGRWATAALSALSGGFALSSIVVGPEGFGPGLILVLWVVIVPLMVLVGLRRLQPQT